MIRISVITGLALAAAASPAAAGIVINEVMYRPHSQSTIGRYEFTELYNNGSTAVDLGGALFTDSQDVTSICHATAPSDHEGVFRIPAGTVVAPGAYLTLWHASVTGVTDQPGNVNDSAMLYPGNLVLNDQGDQVTVLRCDGTTPVILDSLNYDTLGLPEAAENVSIERLDPAAPTQLASNWGFTSVAPGTKDALDRYVAGGTPGRANSQASHSCPVSLVGLTTPAAFASALAADNAGAPDGRSASAATYQFACPSGTPTLDDAVAAVFDDRDFASWPWVDDGVQDLAAMTGNLAPYFDSVIAPMQSTLGAPGEPVEIHEFYGSRLVAPGAHEWRYAWIVLFPASPRVAVVERIDDEL